MAISALAAASLLRYSASGLLGVEVPYLQFYPAIIVSAWYGGGGPALLVTLLAGLGASWFLLPPDGLAVAEITDQLSLAVFLATGAMIAWLSEQRRMALAAKDNATRAAEVRAERLDAVLDITADGIIVIDARGHIEAVNRAAEALFGYPEHELVGRNVSVLMASPHHELHDGYLERYLTTGDARIIGIGREVAGRHRDGRVLPVHLSVGEMRVGGERKFTGLLRDLTGRVSLEDALGASEARWRAVVDSAVDGIIVIDAHGRIEAFNRAAEQLFGYTLDEVLGQNVSVLMPSPYHQEHDHYLTRYQATGVAKIIGKGREVRGRRKDGVTFPLQLSVGEMRLRGERKFTGIVHDLTARVKIEGQLREQESLARLGEMAAVVAHEVKNPLAGIRGAMQVLGSRMAGGSRDAEVVGEIVERIDALDRMMRDMLLFARPPVPKRRPVDVSPLVRSTVELLAADPALQGVAVAIVGDAPPVDADADMLRVVFQNVLLNGAHALHGRGSIHVAIAPSATRCTIAFADTGPGIPAEIRDKVFTPFFTTKSRGSGLGLPTVKRLIDAHQGEVGIDCPPAGGTTVTISLPTSPA